MAWQRGLVNPEMITLARKSRAKTQKELAEATQITQSAISRYEAGTIEADESTIALIANALDYPTSFFTQRDIVQGPGLSELFHRKRTKLPITTINQSYALAEVRRREIARLLESAEEPLQQTPSLPVGSFDDNPETIARTLRALWQLPAGPVFNVTRTLEEKGCIIIGHDFKSHLLDGFSYRSATLPPIFHLNRNMPPDRWRWTLAHELAHIVMHTDIDSADDMKPKEIEYQANDFAGEFMAPGHELAPQLWNLNLDKLSSLKREWKISMQALIMQAHKLNAITARHKQSMFMSLSKAGYRMREPAELDPPIETPAKLFQMVKFHLTTLQYTREEIKDYLGVGETDFQNYYRDPYDFTL